MLQVSWGHMTPHCPGCWSCPSPWSSGGPSGRRSRGAGASPSYRVWRPDRRLFPWRCPPPPPSERQTGSGGGTERQTGSGGGTERQTGSGGGTERQTGSGGGTERQTGSGGGTEPAPERRSLDHTHPRLGAPGLLGGSGPLGDSLWDLGPLGDSSRQKLRDLENER